MGKRNYKDICSAAFYGDSKCLEKLLLPKDVEGEELPVSEKVRQREALINQPGHLTSWAGPVRNTRFGLGVSVVEAPPHSGVFTHRFKASKHADEAATPLHWAVLGGEREAVLWLLRNGARTDLTSTRFGATAREIASRNGGHQASARQIMRDVFCSGEAKELGALERTKTALDQKFAELQRLVGALAATRAKVEVRPLQLSHMGTRALEADQSAARREAAEPVRLLAADTAAEPTPADAPPADAQPADGEAPLTPAALAGALEAAFAKHSDRGLVEELSANLSVPPGRVALLMQRVAAQVRAGSGPLVGDDRLRAQADATLLCVYLLSCEAQDQRGLLRTVPPKPPRAAEEEGGEEEEPPEAAVDPAMDDGTEGVPPDEVPDELANVRQELLAAVSGVGEEAQQAAAKWAVTIGVLLAAHQPLSAPLTLARHYPEPPEALTEAVKAMRPGARFAWQPFYAASADVEPKAETGVSFVISGVSAGMDMTGARGRYPAEAEVLLPFCAVLEVESVDEPAPPAPPPDAGDEEPAAEEDAPAAPSRTVVRLRYVDDQPRALAEVAERAAVIAATATSQCEAMHSWQRGHVEKIAKARAVREYQRAQVEGEEGPLREATAASEEAAWAPLLKRLQEEYEAVAPPPEPVEEPASPDGEEQPESPDADGEPEPEE